jgi:succinyl-CoA synthetase alpha subunit
MEPGRIAIVARSPGLACEAERQLPLFGLGASKVVDLSANGHQGMTHLELLKMFDRHWGTDAVLLLGAIDADEEEACAAWIARHMRKPVIGYIDEDDAACAQQQRLRACGVHMSRDAAQIGALTASLVDSPWLPFD